MSFKNQIISCYKNLSAFEKISLYIFILLLLGLMIPVGIFFTETTGVFWTAISGIGACVAACAAGLTARDAKVIAKSQQEIQKDIFTVEFCRDLVNKLENRCYLGKYEGEVFILILLHFDEIINAEVFYSHTPLEPNAKVSAQYFFDILFKNISLENLKNSPILKKVIFCWLSNLNYDELETLFENILDFKNRQHFNWQLDILRILCQIKDENENEDIDIRYGEEIMDESGKIITFLISLDNNLSMHNTNLVNKQIFSTFISRYLHGDYKIINSILQNKDIEANTKLRVNTELKNIISLGSKYKKQ